MKKLLLFCGMLFILSCKKSEDLNSCSPMSCSSFQRIGNSVDEFIGRQSINCQQSGYSQFEIVKTNGSTTMGCDDEGECFIIKSNDWEAERSDDDCDLWRYTRVKK